MDGVNRTAGAATLAVMPLPKPQSSAVRPRTVPWSYYMNVCTYGYSLVLAHRDCFRFAASRRTPCGIARCLTSGRLEQAFVPWEYWVKHIDW